MNIPKRRHLWSFMTHTSKVKITTAAQLCEEMSIDCYRRIPHIVLRHPQFSGRLPYLVHILVDYLNHRVDPQRRDQELLYLEPEVCRSSHEVDSPRSIWICIKRISCRLVVQ
ncbi:hypothetical protein LENED_003290 [Lentinula edodes]|uniref:Uncharacterized protein n=1 Tax=Lentinula edodes TaxID=5353 RepID=A0A1Q3E374_LENED|nr:hypothetical protein LENED_003290 [Lentinula edodes]